MAEEQTHTHTHHHHHHHHKMDGATKFKRSSLNAIERRKFLEKYGKIALMVIAVLMAIAVIYSYILPI
ncbi:MAG: hypothetical protein J6X74_04350 [Bacteroidaceae bacterium]|nr:hypothetical protein [Bacteroidaceae bacterium]